MSEIFKNIPVIPFEGPASSNPLAFKYYDADRVILGKPMPLITSPEDRGDLMRKYYGIQDVIVEPFTPQFMKQHWPVG